MSLICILEDPETLPGKEIGISAILYFFDKKNMLSQKKE